MIATDLMHLYDTLAFLAQQQTLEERSDPGAYLDLTAEEAYEEGLDDGYIELARNIFDWLGLDRSSANG